MGADKLAASLADATKKRATILQTNLQHGLAMRQGFDLSINDYNRDLFTIAKTVLEQKEGESSVHITLKVLAWGLFYEPELLIEPTDVDPQYKPDLLLKKLDGFPKLWIECGQVKTAKLDKLTSRYPDAQFIAIKFSERHARDLRERCIKDVRRPSNLRHLGFDAGFVESCARHVMGKNQCTIIRSDDTVQFLINGFDASSNLYWFGHEA